MDRRRQGPGCAVWVLLTLLLLAAAGAGRDLMDLGMNPGREIGSMLSELLEYVIDDPKRNEKEILRGYVKEKLGL